MLEGCVPWPPEFAEHYRKAGYWRGETFDELLRRRARDRADHPAVVDTASRITYADLDAAAGRLAAGLSGLDLSPGDRVVVQLPNVATFVTVFFALQRIGAVAVLALPLHRRSEIVHLCRQSGAVAYVIPDEHAGFDYRELAAEVRDDVPGLRHVVVDGEPGPFIGLSDLDAAPGHGHGGAASSDVAVMLVSGGTTGLPKLIPRTHDDYLYNVRASAELCGLGPDDVYLAALPVSHNFALACPGVLGALHAGATAVLTNAVAPDEIFDVIAGERVTVTALVPPTARMWAEATEWSGSDLSSLRLLQVGGARLLPEHARLVRRAFGPVLQQVFGMAEGLLNFTEPDAPEDVVLHTQGRPLSPGDEIRIVDEDDADVSPGELGHLLTRGPYTLRGYYRAPEHNAVSFTEDGYYRTGDLVRKTPTGHLVVEGRAKEQINRGGDKIAAIELEEHLLAHPAVADAAVVAVPDDLLGERTCAFVIAASGSAPIGRSEVAVFLRERGVAPYKIPDRLEVVDAFPVTRVGKTDKRALAAMVASPVAKARS
ncbi:2,3-dihydroxybenzoate-AMP ligase [Nonomuraea mesophila]|uniref:2,3-dihydroxybenzoate-AMP ligase n=1 Tax=Nonomuraea mesophila TaxID=2530382 RepID=A0A4R5FT13_9ACTN|nr:AMP-binding protein [Nonomuraea mesophila]TDE56538.1 2,3-dihydroxybenzoate-AMP ligase [Nonomuraea mesophila]